MIVLRKTLKVIKGDMNLFDDVRYFFYITNDSERPPAEMVQFYPTQYGSDQVGDAKIQKTVQASTKSVSLVRTDFPSVA